MTSIARRSLAAAILFLAIVTCQASDKATLLPSGFHPLPCHSSHSTSRCGRAYYPHFLSPHNASLLLSLALAAFSHTPGGSGPVTIVDMASGALSYKDKFVNLHALLNAQHTTLPPHALHAYLALTRQLSHTLHTALHGNTADIKATERLHLTRPSFFSRITDTDATTVHDEYWHRHIDREQYGTFEATALIYLSDWGTDFTGGEFVFDDSSTSDKQTTESGGRQYEVDATLTAEAESDSSVTAGSGTSADGGSREWIVRPSVGALTFFSSGQENAHYVRRVTRGTRYALTIAFTRDEKHSVEATLDKIYGKQIAAWQASQTAEAEAEAESTAGVG